MIQLISETKSPRWWVGGCGMSGECGRKGHSLVAGFDEADAIALTVETAGEVEVHPTAILALILVRRWTTSRTIKVDAPWASSRPDSCREEFKRVCTVVDRAMDVAFLLSESRSGRVYIDLAATTLEGKGALGYDDVHRARMQMPAGVFSTQYGSLRHSHVGGPSEGSVKPYPPCRQGCCRHGICGDTKKGNDAEGNRKYEFPMRNDSPHFSGYEGESALRDYLFHDHSPFFGADLRMALGSYQAVTN